MYVTCSPMKINRNRCWGTLDKYRLFFSIHPEVFDIFMLDFGCFVYCIYDLIWIIIYDGMSITSMLCSSGYYQDVIMFLTKKTAVTLRKIPGWGLIDNFCMVPVSSLVQNSLKWLFLPLFSADLVPLSSGASGHPPQILCRWPETRLSGSELWVLQNKSLRSSCKESH